MHFCEDGSEEVERLLPFLHCHLSRVLLVYLADLDVTFNAETHYVRRGPLVATDTVAGHEVLPLLLRTVVDVVFSARDRVCGLAGFGDGDEALAAVVAVALVGRERSSARDVAVTADEVRVVGRVGNEWFIVVEATDAVLLAVTGLAVGEGLPGALAAVLVGVSGEVGRDGEGAGEVVGGVDVVGGELVERHGEVGDVWTAVSSG